MFTVHQISKTNYSEIPTGAIIGTTVRKFIKEFNLKSVEVVRATYPRFVVIAEWGNGEGHDAFEIAINRRLLYPANSKTFEAHQQALQTLNNAQNAVVEARAQLTLAHDNYDNAVEADVRAAMRPDWTLQQILDCIQSYPRYSRPLLTILQVLHTEQKTMSTPVNEEELLDAAMAILPPHFSQYNQYDVTGIAEWMYDQFKIFDFSECRNVATNIIRELEAFRTAQLVDRLNTATPREVTRTELPAALEAVASGKVQPREGVDFERMPKATQDNENATSLQGWYEHGQRMARTKFTDAEMAFGAVSRDYCAAKLPMLPGDYTNREARDNFAAGWESVKNAPASVKLTKTQLSLLRAANTDGVTEGALYGNSLRAGRKLFSLKLIERRNVKGFVMFVPTDAGRAALAAHTVNEHAAKTAKRPLPYTDKDIVDFLTNVRIGDVSEYHPMTEYCEERDWVQVSHGNVVSLTSAGENYIANNKDE